MALTPITVRLSSLTEAALLRLTATTMAFSYKIEPLPIPLATGLGMLESAYALVTHRAVTPADLEKLELSSSAGAPFLDGDKSSVVSLDSILIISSLLRRNLDDFWFTLEGIHVPIRPNLDPRFQLQLDDFILRLLKIAHVRFKSSTQAGAQ